MRDKHGGPAFPLPRHTRKYCDKTNDYIQDDGMTLRDYFAAKALQGLAVGGGYDKWEYLAQDSYAIADAMLKAREVGNE